MNRRVMLIEDDAAMQELIGGYLANYGFEVRTFGEPQAALQELKTNAAHYGIVVLDEHHRSTHAPTPRGRG